MKDKLCEANISQTVQRMVLGKLFLSQPRHCTADMLYEETKAQGFRFSRATIYNTLRVFVAKGMAKEVYVHDGKQFFDSNTSEHHHFFDEKTGELSDLPADLFSADEIVNRLKSSYPEYTNARVNNLVIRGTTAN